MLVKFLDGTSREVALEPYANLSGANLRCAILSGANLRSANLRGANLSYANLSGAILSGAILSGAILTGVNLRSANLRGAILRGADLRGANLRDANLSDTDLSDVKGLAQFVIAGEGALIGYKKLKNSVIAKLRIPEDTARVNAYGSRKCRAAYVVVVSGEGVSRHDGVTKYAPGKCVTADNFDPDPRVECSGGIHFFLTEQEAKEH